MSLTATPVIALTTGEPAGIGPEIALVAAARFALDHRDFRVVLIGDFAMLLARSKTLVPVPELTPFVDGALLPDRALEVLHVPLGTRSEAGKLDAKNAPSVLATLDAAIDGCLTGRFQAVATAPVQKSIINEAGIPFTGHTEYLAMRAHALGVVMMLVGGGLRVALATTHLPLREVAEAITASGLDQTLEILERDLKDRFGIRSPRILVCGVNPHAGEHGFLGREEIDVIEPAILRAQRKGMKVSGPYPADTLFQPKYLDGADAILAMYHDQGLTVLKYASFGRGVNVTLGLPLIRTSVDHGTALDLAGSGRADANSMEEALNMAATMIRAARAA